MTATAAINGSAQFYGNPLPTYLDEGLAANAQAGRAQFVTVSPSTGYAALNDGTVPDQIAAGAADVQNLTDTSTQAGKAVVRCSQRLLRGIPASTIANDGFDATSAGKPWYIASENAPGALSNYSGSNRTLGGLVLGVDDTGAPILWTGIVAQQVGRCVAMANATNAAHFAISDAAASTATAERIIPSAKVHGLVTAIQFIGAAVAADNTDYVTITIAKRDGSGGGAVTLGTYDSRAANQGGITAFTPAAFSLSAVAGALNLLETDVITLTVVKGGSGKTLTGAFRVICKAG